MPFLGSLCSAHKKKEEEDIGDVGAWAHLYFHNKISFKTALLKFYHDKHTILYNIFTIIFA